MLFQALCDWWIYYEGKHFISQCCWTLSCWGWCHVFCIIATIQRCQLETNFETILPNLQQRECMRNKAGINTWTMHSKKYLGTQSGINTEDMLHMWGCIARNPPFLHYSAQDSPSHTTSLQVIPLLASTAQPWELQAGVRQGLNCACVQPQPVSWGCHSVTHWQFGQWPRNQALGTAERFHITPISYKQSCRCQNIAPT